MTVELLPYFNNVLTPPMTKSLHEKLRVAREEKFERDSKLVDIRSFVGIKYAKPEITDDELEIFMDCVTSDKNNAIEILIINSIVGLGSECSLSYHLLRIINRKIQILNYSEDQLLSLFYILADVTDEMTKINGPVSPSGSRIAYKSSSLSEEIIRKVSPEKRANALLRVLKYGNAKSFVISLIWRILKNHKYKDSFWKRFVPLLEKSELETIEREALEKVKEILNNGIQSVPDSIYLFLYWYEFGDDNEICELRSWIHENTKTDVDFVNFISVFSEKARISFSKVDDDDNLWVVYTELLSQIIGNSSYLDRLVDLSISNCEAKQQAKELLGRIEQEKKLISDGRTLRKYFE